MANRWTQDVLELQNLQLRVTYELLNELIWSDIIRAALKGCSNGYLLNRMRLREKDIQKQRNNHLKAIVTLDIFTQNKHWGKKLLC